MSWPTPQEYNEAVQNPHYNFAEAELQRAVLDTDALGLPRVASGSFASVYKIRCQTRDLAVRCFLTETPDQQQRYEQISYYLRQVRLACIATFDYLRQGIRAGGRWCPILKMEWIYGQPLDLYVKQHVHDRQRILQLAENFRAMVEALRQCGIAHGDLQHGNILISDDLQCRLVDYDGMFVPSMKGYRAHELGHRNYQHPARDHLQFHERLDHFSAWSIYTSLLCLSEDPELLKRVAGCDECLLFRQPDYRYPLRSLTFFTLEAHDSELVRALARSFRALLDRRLEEIPPLNEWVAAPTDLPVLTNVFSASPILITSRAGKTDLSMPSDLAEARQFYAALSDYNYAAANPAKSFFDAELKQSILALDHGHIRPLIGEQGAVFRFHGADGKELAAKVFFRPDVEREERYHLLKQYLEGDNPELAHLKQYLTSFSYQRDGIRMHNNVYPIVKMDWVTGKTLFDTIESNKSQREATRTLAKKFKTMMAALRRAGIIHGDIDAENILVTNNGLKLIDYDCLRTPISLAVPINELSNRHFRHPRIKQSLPEHNDNFPSWVVYTSLYLLAIQPDLWYQAGIKPGRLLFHQRDLINPASSPVFQLLEAHYSSVVRTLASQLKMFACWEPEHVPMLFDEPKTGHLPDLMPVVEEKAKIAAVINNPVSKAVSVNSLLAKSQKYNRKPWVLSIMALTTVLLMVFSPGLGILFGVAYIYWLVISR